jgi:hypothetical protein
MSFTNFPNGLTSFGIPVLGGGQISIPNRPEQIFFVDQTGAFSTTGTQSSTTIQAALNQVISGAGATIFVFPGTYEENLTIADLDYVSIIGAMIPGYARPDIAPSTGIVLEVTTSQGFVAQNVRFAGSDADTVIQRGNGFIYNNCVFDGDAGQAATEGNLRLVGVAADDSYTASEGIVANSYFRGSTSGAGIIIQHAANPSGVGTSDNQIIGNRFVANGVDLLTAANVSGGGAGIFINYLIAHNFFQTVGAAYVYADMDQGAAGDLTANSGLICNNWFADEALVAAQFDIATMANVIFTGNYDAAGLVDGSAFN